MGIGDDSSESEEPTVVHRGVDGASLSEREKVVVLFGNDNYHEPHWTKLTCCKSDVKALMPKFHDQGFLPVHACDVSSKEFDECIEHASNYIGGKTKVVVFHWSGHGQYDDRTWLVATDGTRIDLREALEKLLEKVTRSVTTFVILDCCRNSPANKSSSSTDFEGSIEREKQSGDLWQESCEEMYVKAPQGHGPKRRKFVFFFATGPGETAREVKSGRHGVLTRAVLQHLFREDDLSTITNDINSQVQRDTKQMQRSWISSNAVDVIGNPIVLKSCCFKVASEASKQIRKYQDCLDKQQELTEEYARQILELKEKPKVASPQRGVHDDDDSFLPRLQNYPASSPSSLQLSRRISNGSTSYACKPWIAIDGNIGVGKTNLLIKEFKREISSDVEKFKEPVEEWSEGPLKKIYNKKSSTSDVFEAQVEIWQHFQEMAFKYDQLDKIYITERSPISVVKIFCQNFLDEERITQHHFELFQNFYDVLKDKKWLPTHYVLLEASVATCQERIKRRNRNEEQAIPDEYLEKIQALLEKVYRQVEKDGGTVIRINAEEAEEVVKETFIRKMGSLL